MIVVRLQGGLGNQMFQFAFAYVLSKKNIDPDIYIDLRQLAKSNNEFLDNGIVRREFALSCFNLDVKFWDEAFDEWFFPTNLLSRFIKKMKVVAGITTLLFEESFSYNEDLIKIAKGDIYCVGFWQAEKYYSDFKNELKKVFRFDSTFNSSVEKFKFLIKSYSNSLSIHVRRGDYLSLAASEVHAICGKEYYIEAISRMNAEGLDPDAYFIFSDDIQWCKENFNFDKPVYFVSEETTITDIGEMYLMTLCKHHIIANSSFSWWGAYLGLESGSVIYPKRWFRPDVMNHQIQDLFPGDWIGV